MSIFWRRTIEMSCVKIFSGLRGCNMGRELVQTDQGYPSHQLPIDLDTYRRRYWSLFKNACNPTPLKKFPFQNLIQGAFCYTTHGTNVWTKKFPSWKKLSWLRDIMIEAFFDWAADCVGDYWHFDAGWGPCHTYAYDANHNHGYCESDNDGEHYAYEVCPECERCYLEDWEPYTSMEESCTLTFENKTTINTWENLSPQIGIKTLIFNHDVFRMIFY